MSEPFPTVEAAPKGSLSSRFKQLPRGRQKLKPMRPVDLSIDFRPDDVLVATFPRSGTTWTVELVRLLHLRHIARTDHPLTTEKGKKGCFLEKLLRETGSEIVEGMESPRIFKTHSYYNECKFLSAEKNCKIIYVYRDPKDVVCSVFEHANIKRGLERDMAGKRMENVARRFYQKKSVSRMEDGPADWFDLNEGYMSNPSNYNILYIKYEDLQARTGETISSINDFLGYPALSKDEEAEIVLESSFDRMKLTHKELAGKTVGKIGRHEGFLSTESITGIDQKIMELMEKVDDSQFNLSCYIKQ